MTALTLPSAERAPMRLWRRQGDRQLQLRYLSSAITLEETINPYLVRSAMLTVSFVVMAFILWSVFAHVSEVSRAYGAIEPKSLMRVVQHMDGGIVKDILVSERQLVKAGDVLLRLDGTGASQDAGELLARQSALALQIERLHAVLERRKPNFASINAADVMKRQATAAYASMMAAHDDELDVMRQQVLQKKDSVRVLNSRIAALQKNLQLSRSESGSLSALKAQGLVTQSRLSESERRLNETQGDLGSLASQRDLAQATIAEYQKRLSMLDSKQTNQLYDDLYAAETEYAQNAQRSEKLGQRAGRLEVRAPVTGVVKGLHVNTIGSVVKPGETLLELMPADDTLVAVVRIRPQDMGQVNEGQKVRVKISSYDFARFGALGGTLSQVSATTFNDDSGNAYYRGEVSLDTDHIGDDPKAHRIMPGMTLEADIVTGEKSVMGYMLKPVQVALAGALTEK